MLIEIKLLLDVIEDELKVSRLSVHESGCGGHGWGNGEVEKVKWGEWGI